MTGQVLALVVAQLLPAVAADASQGILCAWQQQHHARALRKAAMGLGIRVEICLSACLVSQMMPAPEGRMEQCLICLSQSGLPTLLPCGS